MKVLCMGEDGTEPFNLAQSNRHVKARGSCFKDPDEAGSLNPLYQPMHRLPRVESDAPKPWAPPSAELNAKVEAMASWKEAYVSGGRVEQLLESVEAAGRLDRDMELNQRSDYPADLVLAMEDYSEVGKEVLRAGFTMCVDDAGRPHISCLEKIEVNMKTGLIQALAVEVGVVDHEALWALDFGALSHSDTPEVTVYSQNHNGAVQHKLEMTEHLKAEVAEGFVVPSDVPPSIPLCIRPMSMVPKIKAEDGKLVIKGWRLVIDASYPGKGRMPARRRGQTAW